MINRLYVMDVSFLEDSDTFEYWLEKMKPERRAKVDAMKPEASKRLSLGAGILLDKALDEIGVAEYKLEIRGRGKPYLKNLIWAKETAVSSKVVSSKAASSKAAPAKDTSSEAASVKAIDAEEADVFFNLSHSGTKVALGISDKEIGVDIEKVRVFKDNLIKRVFSQDEKKIAQMMSYPDISGTKLPGLDNARRTALDGAYTALWTAKESLMKHCGMGMALMPERIEFSIDETIGEHRRLYASCEDYDCSNLHFTLYEPEGYRLCVCSEYEEFEYHEE